MLSDSQLKLTAETLSNIGIVFFASMVVPIFTGIGTTPNIVLSGILLSIIFWFGSLFVINKTSS